MGMYSTTDSYPSLSSLMMLSVAERCKSWKQGRAWALTIGAEHNDAALVCFPAVEDLGCMSA
jgi:hypothetical protein